MSFWILTNFLRNKLLQNEEVQNSMDKLAADIEKNENLQKEQQAGYEEKFRLQTDLEMLTSFAELLQEEHERRLLMVAELKAARDSFIGLQRQLRQIDLKKLAYYEMLVNEMKRQQEWKEMEEVFRQKQEIRQQMENRRIVQQLRYKQTELKEALTQSEEGLEFIQKKCVAITKKLEDSEDRRNQIILCLVKGTKELENLRKEIKNILNQKQEIHNLQQKRDGLKSQLKKFKALGQESSLQLISTQHLGDGDEALFKRPVQRKITDSNWKVSIIPPIIDPFNPMAFLEAMQIKFDMTQSTRQTFSINQREHLNKVVSKEGRNELRPILKLGNWAPKEARAQEQQNATRHVRFLEPDITGSSSSNCSSPTLSFEMDEKLTTLSTTNDFNVTPSTNNTESEANKVENGDLLTPDLQKPSSELLSESYSAAGESPVKSKFGVEILDCRVIDTAVRDSAKIKSQASDLLSNPSTVTDTYTILPAPDSTEQSAIPQFPALVAPIFKSPKAVPEHNTAAAKAMKQVLDNLLRQSTEKKPTTNNKATKRKILDFDSMFLSNSSSEKEEEEEEDNDLGRTKSTNEILDFGCAEALESDDGELMKFSDNEWLAEETGTNEDFL